MDRKKFIKNSCLLCSSVTFLANALEGCASVKYAACTLNENGLLIDKAEFESKQGLRPYVIAGHDSLQFPICIYRINEDTYSALLMQCTHQGAELQVSGDQLTCPAHGSEFDKWGKVQQSPAGRDLRRFPVSVSGDQLFIDLRKQSL